MSDPNNPNTPDNPTTPDTPGNPDIQPPQPEITPGIEPHIPNNQPTKA